MPELLAAARVSLGALGVLTEVSLRTVPAFRLHKVEQPRRLADVLAGLDELVGVGGPRRALRRAVVVARAGDVVAADVGAGSAAASRLRTWVNDELLANRALDVLQRTGRRVPRLQPTSVG